MRFRSNADELFAAAAAVRWLPELLTRVEAGVRKLGLVIAKKSINNYPDGAVEPVLLLRPRCKRGPWTFELRLRNALEEFLTVDRDEEPVRVDPRLLDETFAEKKLASIIGGRLAMVRALSESRDPAEFKRKMEELAPRFEHVRLWEYEGGKKQGDKPCDGS